MIAPISVCIIVKNEPLLEECVKSIRDFVKEIVIVDTGSTDGTAQRAKKLADVFESYAECNNPETGLIEDFSMARQRSFDLATQPWVMWVDSDDIVTGAENLINLTTAMAANGNSVAFMFPYEYSYNELGQCTCLHYRERLFSNKNDFHWTNPVHEVVVPYDNNKVTFITDDSVVYKHKRQYSNKVPESGRNLRILKRYFEKVGDTDARQMYYIGLEYYNNGFVEEAIQHLSRYVDISGWDDERAMACLKLIDIYMARGDYNAGLKWAFKTISIKENWGEGYFALGKMFYFLAINGGPNEQRHWERCAHFSRLGLSLPVTKTLLFINPLDRSYDIHRYLNMALNKIGDVVGALESVKTALVSQPNDTSLLNNKKIYERWLASRELISSANALKSLGELDDDTLSFINAVANKSPLSNTRIISSNKSESWQIPETRDLHGLPLNVNENQLESTVIMIWKQFMLHDEIDKAILFLENAPYSVCNSSDIKEALELTKKFKEENTIVRSAEDLSVRSEKLQTSTPLDIILWAGDGVEVWTPETVKKTGIGGSELMLLEQAKRLAALGHKVRVYNSCGFFGAGTYDGVQYNQTNKFKDLECDVLVVSRRADMLGDQYNIKAKLKLLWVHDVVPINFTNELLLKADRILCLSEWHKQNVMQQCNIHSDHIIVTRNGIDMSRFENKDIKRNKFKAINASSPDRSWPVILDIWPRIKEKVPQAELHLYYGFANWKYSAQYDQLQMDLINRLEAQIKSMEYLGVVYHDRINQEELANEFLSAGVLLHSTWFTETFGITFANAQAAGMKIVTSSIAALNEVVADRGVLIDGDWTSIEYQNKFVAAAIEAMTNE